MKKQAYSYSTLPSVYKRAMVKTRRLGTTTSKVIHAYLVGYVADEPEESDGISIPPSVESPHPEPQVTQPLEMEPKPPVLTTAETVEAPTIDEAPTFDEALMPEPDTEVDPPGALSGTGSSPGKKSQKVASPSTGRRAGAVKKGAGKPQRSGGTRLNKNKKATANSQKKGR